MKQITDFINNELVPSVYEQMDRVFPELHFERSRYGWDSKYHRDGTESKSGTGQRSRVSKNKPKYIWFNREQACVDVVTYYKETHPHLTDTIEAVKEMASLVGIEVPTYSKEDESFFKEYKKKQDNLEDLFLRMVSELQTNTKAEQLRQYLIERGYTPERWGADRMGLGFVSPEIASYMYKNNDSLFHTKLTMGIGSDFVLSIPYRSGNQLLGFTFRKIGKNVGDKMREALITDTASKSFHLYGLTGLKLTGNGEKDKDITIVEGELDCLNAIDLGVKNVVAMTGGSLSVECLQEAKQKGVRRATILFDTEETPAYARMHPVSGLTPEEAEKRAEKRILDMMDHSVLYHPNGKSGKLLKAIRTIRKAGLVPFVATLPQPQDGDKQDPDSFLKDHTPEELQAIIDNRTTAPMFLFDLLLKDHSLDGSEYLTDTETDNLKDAVIRLCNDRELCSPTDRDQVLATFSNLTGGAISIESIKAEADLELETDTKALQKDRTENSLKEALLKVRNGENPVEVLKRMEPTIKELKGLSNETNFAHLLDLPTTEQTLKLWREIPEGVETDYTFSTYQGGEHKNKNKLVLPSGALSFICAPTTHGKSMMMRNLALSMVKRFTDSSVLYFTYEEEQSRIKLQFLNLYAGIEFNIKNLQTLEEHYQGRLDIHNVRTGQRDLLNNDSLFSQKESEFLDLLNTGRLRIFSETYDSIELAEAIRYLCKNLKDTKPVKAVFIDYVQRLKRKGNKEARYIELKNICDDLLELAIEQKLPIVLGCQLNREGAKSPIELESQMISDSSDIEKVANVILCLWNSVMTPRKGSEYNGELEPRGVYLGQGGKMYAKLTKCRGGEVGQDAVLDCNGNTGAITQTDPDKALGESICNGIVKTGKGPILAPPED